MMDYGYYVNEFGGRLISEGEFDRLVEQADEVIRAVIFPKSAEGLSCGEKRAYDRALCYEAEFLFEGKAGSGGLKSEKVGDYSVEYCDASSGNGINMYGWVVSPAACHVLLASGLLTRWV